MAESNATSEGTGAFRIVFVIGAILSLLYGLIFLLIPEWQLNLSQDPGIPGNPGWVRWAGGSLIGLAVANWLVSSNPEKQGPYVTGVAVGTTLVALALLYSALAGEYQGVAWVVWLPIAINVVLAGSYWWLRSKYKDVL